MVAAANQIGLYVTVPLYLLAMGAASGMAWYGKRGKVASKTSDAMSAHYLGGRAFGPFVTTMTLFASLFSGYTVVGIPNEAFENGFIAARWVVIGISHSFGLLISAPRLRKCGLVRNHQTPVDFVTDRYRSNLLRYTVVLLQVFPSWLYLTGQLRAMTTTFNVALRD